METEDGSGVGSGDYGDDTPMDEHIINVQAIPRGRSWVYKHPYTRFVEPAYARVLPMQRSSLTCTQCSVQTI